MKIIKLPSRKEAKKMSYYQLEKLWEQIGKWYEKMVDILEDKEEERN